MYKYTMVGMPLSFWLFQWLQYLKKIRIPIMSQDCFSLFTFEFTMSSGIIQICVEVQWTSDRKFMSLGVTCTRNNMGSVSSSMYLRITLFIDFILNVVPQKELYKLRKRFSQGLNRHQYDTNKTIQQQCVIILQRYHHQQTLKKKTVSVSVFENQTGDELLL